MHLWAIYIHCIVLSGDSDRILWYCRRCTEYFAGMGVQGLLSRNSSGLYGSKMTIPRNIRWLSYRIPKAQIFWSSIWSRMFLESLNHWVSLFESIHLLDLFGFIYVCRSPRHASDCCTLVWCFIFTAPRRPLVKTADALWQLIGNLTWIKRLEV